MTEGWEVEDVKADLTGQGFDKDGNLTLTFTVDRNDKWRAAPITDIRARAFELTIRACGKRIHLAPGGLELARQRVQEAMDEDS